MIGDVVKGGLAFMIPPAPKDEPAIVRWRWSVFITILALCASMAGHVLMAEGVWGYEGYAREGDLAEARAELDNLANRVEIFGEAQLDEQIHALRKDQCHALRAENVEAIAHIGERLRRRLVDYRHLTGREYRLPTCPEVGVMSAET